MNEITGNWRTKEVKIDGKVLDSTRSQKVYNHSPDGFNWNYGGSGPAQLALAIMLEFCLNEEIALKLYQDFKWDVVAHLPATDFVLPVEIVTEWISKKLQ